MELNESKIYLVVDKDFEYYTKDVIKSQFIDQDEANKMCDDLNLKHFISIEGKAANSDIKNRYTVMSMVDAMNFIVERVKLGS